jgi:hypothetical protein
MSPSPEPADASIDLLWIPLGAGGVGFVRQNGRLYEAIKARFERRQPADLYHSALEITSRQGRFTVENAWPSPNSDLTSRGVVAEGPVFSRRLARLRTFRYEIRVWRDGIIPDRDQAVEGPRRLSEDPKEVRALLDQAAAVPILVWGRDESGTGEMWNSNSVIAWLLERTGLPAADLFPPAGGRAPGWKAGIAVARR